MVNSVMYHLQVHLIMSNTKFVTTVLIITLIIRINCFKRKYQLYSLRIMIVFKLRVTIITINKIKFNSFD
jgi:hypothetical protein